MLRRDDVELKQLAQSAAEVQQANTENARLARVRVAQRNQEQNAHAEIERMNREGNALVGEYKAFIDHSKNQSLTVSERAVAEASAKLKMAEIQAKQREIQAFIASIRVSLPEFQSKGRAELHRTRSATDPAISVPGVITAVDSPSPNSAPGTYTFTPINNEQASIRLPQVDPGTALSAYERVAGRRVIRDPSIAGITGRLDLQTGPANQKEISQALQGALREQLNIILEPAADGTVVAKLGPPR
jgi:hypothetical protein